MDPLCAVCESRHHPRQAHRFATNTPVATNKVATNRIGEVAGANPVGRATKPESPVAQEIERPVPLGKTLNRRDRSAYNAYQREYMRKQRRAA